MSMIYYKTAGETSVYECPDTEDWDIDELAAARCAEDFHANHDGWEYDWPLDLYLADAEVSPSWTRFIVDREYDPSFSARKVKP